MLDKAERDSGKSNVHFGWRVDLVFTTDDAETTSSGQARGSEEESGQNIPAKKEQMHGGLQNVKRTYLHVPVGM